MAPESNKTCSKVGPIAHVKALASILSTTPSELIALSENVPSLWKPGKVLRKKDGTPRPTHDARKALKVVHERIKNRLLRQVDYPGYLLGGISDKLTTRDYSRHAALHAKKKILISEDIQDFFPSTTAEVVQEIWQRLFNFHPDVAELLTRLTIYEGALPQGWKTSGYLANLALWRREPDFVARLHRQGLAYSRFMDDVTVSAPYPLSKTQLTNIISGIYGMLASGEFAPKRAKHKIATGRSRMEVTGLNVNAAKPSMPKKRRDQIRAQVYQCEQGYKRDPRSPEYLTQWRNASGKVGTMKRFNPGEAKSLRTRPALYPQVAQTSRYGAVSFDFIS
ncbi:reverse transcriptase family protein [Thioalkalivibrio nitratireducens]|uniref:reverse transcriptase family protein n=1 Tax=Thioalkalivibrio nitratireducens TaxID=186931 RepID=UPI0003126455|nr:reverse transcriptase family protein [Thioalkalivibrio nitratireducens]